MERAQGIAILIPPMPKREAVALLERLDGLMIPGGADIHPGFYGETPIPNVEDADQPRDNLEMALIRAAEAPAHLLWFVHEDRDRRGDL